jgi:hypothetical protein
MIPYDQCSWPYQVANEEEMQQLQALHSSIKIFEVQCQWLTVTWHRVSNSATGRVWLLSSAASRLGPNRSDGTTMARLATSSVVL